MTPYEPPGIGQASYSEEARRHRLLNVLLRWMLFIAVMLSTIAIGTWLAGLWKAEGSEFSRLIVSASMFVVGTLLCYALNHARKTQAASILWIGIIIFVIVICDEPERVIVTETASSFIIPIILASILLRPIDSFLVTWVINIIFLFISIFIIHTFPNIFTLGSFWGIAIVAWASASSLNRALTQLQREIGERERAQQSLAQSNERFRVISELTSDYAYSFSVAPNGTLSLEWFSEAFTRITGYTAEEVRSWGNLDAFIHPDDRPKSDQRVARVSDGKPDISEFRIVTKSGDIRWVRSYIRPVRTTPDGPVVRLYGATQDITDQKRSAEALLQQERSLQSIYRASPIGIGVVVNRVFTMVNDRVCEMTGYTREEILGRSTRIVYPDQEEFDRVGDVIYANASKWGVGMDESRWLTKDGRVIDILLGLCALDPNDMSCGVTFTVLDITDRKQTERALRESEARYRALFEQMQDGFVVREAILDENGVPYDYRYIEVNPAWEKITGVSSADRLGKTIREIRPDLGQDWFDIQARIALTGEAVHYEDHNPVTDKWYAVSAFSPKPGQVASTVTDITQRVRAEEALRESEKRFREILENVQLVALLLDNTGHVTFCNQFTLDLLGMRREEVVGQDWFERFVPDEVKQRIQPIFLDRVDQGQLPAHYENPILTRHGESRLILWDNTVMRDPQGRVTGIASLGRDVTEQRQLETRFLQAQKMEVVGRLAGGIAHDFNNLLTVINGYSEIMLGNMRPGDPGYAEMTEIYQAGMRAADLTAQLLAFSRKQVSDPRALDLNEMLTDMAPMLTRLIGEDIHLTIKPGPALGMVRADPGQMQQVLLNLVVNARDAMPQGGHVTIETANVMLDSGHMLRDPEITSGPYLMLAVSDTGIGMTDAVKEHLFEPFFTTKGVGKGTGLGLSTIYGIVKQNGGTISVYSEPGLGSTFKVYLPRVDAVVGEKVATETGLPRGDETILVVEDNADVRRFTERLLRILGYHVLSAQNGPDALALMAETREHVQAVLTDVVMPEMSGREFATKLEATHPHAKIVYMSGYTDDAIVHHGVLEANVPYIQKPFTLEALARKIRAVLDSDLSPSGGNHP